MHSSHFERSASYCYLSFYKKKARVNVRTLNERKTWFPAAIRLDDSPFMKGQTLELQVQDVKVTPLPGEGYTLSLVEPPNSREVQENKFYDGRGGNDRPAVSVHLNGSEIVVGYKAFGKPPLPHVSLREVGDINEALAEVRRKANSSIQHSVLVKLLKEISSKLDSKQ